MSDIWRSFNIPVRWTHFEDDDEETIFYNIEMEKKNIYGKNWRRSTVSCTMFRNV